MLVTLLCSNTLSVNYRAGEAGQPKMYFCDRDGILAPNYVCHTFKCVAVITCLIKAVPLGCFCGVQWLLIYVINIQNVECLVF